MLTVTLYNLSVKLETNEQKLIDKVDLFVKRYYTSTGQSFSGNNLEEKKYVSKLLNRGVYYLHTNQFIHLLHHLKETDTDISHAERIDHREYQVATENYELREGPTLRDYQIPINTFLTESPKGSKLVSLQTGKGKAQPLTSKIKTPTGWITMGEVQVGTIVTARDGTPTTVTGVYPQGTRPTYKLTYQDRRSCEASDSHLWKVYVKDWTTNLTSTKVLTTKELIRLLDDSNISTYIDLPTPENPPPLPITYTLDLNQPLPQDLIERGSLEQRRQLLTSLLTTTIDDPITYLYSTNVPLLLQAQYLVRSLGGIAKLSKHTLPTAIHTLSIWTKELFTPDTDSGRIELSSITQLPPTEVQCISIDHPDRLYITDDFIVTHNTMISMWALSEVAMRIGIVVLPVYIDKWIQDVVKLHHATPKDIMVVQGSKSVRGLVAMAKDNELNSKYFIFSSRTLQEYISHYEENPEETVNQYGISPIELFPLLQIGSLLIDETHQQFHAIFKILLHTNVKYQVGLSATLISDDEVVSRVHKVVYTPKNTYDGVELDRYTDVYALSYSMSPDFARHIRTTNYGSNSYSHTAFEQSVIKASQVLRFYEALIDCTLKDFYIDKYETNDKCVIFVATVKLATMLTKRYSTMYPDKVTLRYCEDDPFKHLYEADIIVTTIISAGTAVDIPDLRVVIQSVSVSSPVANIQSLGRLRKLEDGKDTRFCYLYADNIPKQKQYHYRRKELFYDRVATHRSYKARVSV